MQGYNFTERARKVLELARDEARRLRHEYVGTEHLLLGLLREGEGVAVQVLRNLGANTDRLRRRVEDVVPARPDLVTTGPELPFTSRGKTVLEQAMSEARELGHSYLGTEHLLLGLLREEKGVAAQILVEAGVRIDAARAETVRLLAEPYPGDGSAAQPDAVSSAPTGQPGAASRAPTGQPSAPPVRRGAGGFCGDVVDYLVRVAAWLEQFPTPGPRKR